MKVETGDGWIGICLVRALTGKFRLSRAQSLWALGMFFSASLVVLFVVDLQLRYDDAIAGARRDAQNYARILAEHAVQSFERLDGTLRAAEQIRQNDLLGGYAGRDGVNAALRRLQLASALSVAVGWTNAAGDIIAHSDAGAPPRANIAEMAHFTAHREGTNERLFISPPFRSAADDRWLSAASRRLDNPDGSFAGVVTAPIDQSYFNRIFQSVDLRSHGAVVLMHHSGQLLTREPMLESAIGKSFVDEPLLTKHLPNAESGSYETASAIDGAARIIGYQTVPGLPLVVAVTYARADVLAQWYRHLYTFGALLVILVLARIAGTRVLVKQTAGLASATKKLAEGNAALELVNTRFDAALANMPDGLSMFNADGRLVICNRAYRDMYGLAEEQTKPGTTIRQIVESFVASGKGPDFDQEKFIDSATRREPGTIRLADGRIFLVRRTSMRDGGWIATHEDVTEQKRIESLLIERAAALEQINIRFDAALTNLPNGLVVFDADQRLVICNQRFREMYGLTEAQARHGILRSDLLAQSPFMRKGAVLNSELYLKAAKNREAVVHELLDGRLMAVRVMLIPGGGWVAVHEDVTREKQAEELLREKAAVIERTNMRFDAALSDMPNGLVMFDAEARLVISNCAYREMYGLTEAQVQPGTPLRRVLEYHVANGETSELGIDGFIEAAKTQPVQTHVLADGRTIIIRRRSMPDGGWVATHEDVTEQKRAEAALIESASELRRINAQFDAALNNMSQGLCMFDAEQRIVVSNQQYAAIYRLDRDSVKPGNSLGEVLESRRRRGTNFLVAPQEYLSVNVKKAAELQELADGRVVAIKRQPMPDGGWLTVHEDVTERQRVERERDQNRAFLHQIIDQIPTQITVKDVRSRHYVLVNRIAEANFGLPAGELIGKSVYDIYPKETADIVTADDDKALQSETGYFLDEHEFVGTMGEPRFITAKRIAIRDERGTSTYLLNAVDDVTSLKRSNDRAAYLAQHDHLTGLANRSLFGEKLAEASRRVKRQGAGFNVLMLDLDKFKAVNDTLGHPAGDQLLVQVAARLKSTIRDTDLLARLGGDEFAIIQEVVPNQHEAAISLALRIIELISEPFDLGGHRASVGTSIGISFAPEHAVDPDDLMKMADLALYEAKSGGRNDFRVFKSEMSEAAVSQKLLEADLKFAIADNQFELHYQPVVSAATRKIRSFEALVRWRHPTRGLVSPDQFIPLAESTRLILPLGEWILQKACADAAAWPDDINVAVNISAVQFSKGNLLDVVLCTLVESGLSPNRLELEITETALLENQEGHLSTIRQLKNLGVSIVLDDFGTGYSSANYLIRFPFDRIKIDKSFIRGAPERRECTAVITSALALARGLDIGTTAEGVETEEQFEYLRDAGVDLVQGYLFGRPELATRLSGPSAAAVVTRVA